MKSTSKPSKTVTQHSVASRRTDITAAGELAAISRTISRYKSDPQALQQALQNAGIITKTGKLTREYRS